VSTKTKQKRETMTDVEIEPLVECLANFANCLVLYLYLHV